MNSHEASSKPESKSLSAWRIFDQARLSPLSSDLVLLLSIFFILRLPWIFTIPMKEAPDEYAHYWVIKFLRENFRLPHAAEVFAGGPSAVYGSMPQLGYIPHLLTSLLLPLEDLALSERFGSLLMGGLMLFAAYRIGKLLFSNERLLALSVPAAVAFHPQLVFLHCYANNDSTSSALASILLWLALETVARGLTFKRTLIMGALIGWVAISKYSGLAIIPVMGVALVSSVFIHGTSIPYALSSIAAAGVLAASLSLWWFVQNSHEYPGDPMGTKTMYKTWAVAFNREMNYYLPVSHIIKSIRWWRMMYFSFWGLFGYMDKYLWRPIYLAYVGFLIVSALGWLSQLIRTVLNLRPFTEFFKSPFKGLSTESAKAFIMWFCLALTVLINLTSMVWASVYNLGGPQGRYLFTSEIPVMALLIGGFSAFDLFCRSKNTSPTQQKSADSESAFDSGTGTGSGSAATAAKQKICIGKILTITFLAFNLAVTIGSWIYLFNLYGGWHARPL